jgi:holo-[acyl-carrier protein] synthase
MPNTGGSPPDASQAAQPGPEAKGRILGIGIDLIAVERIARGEARQGPDFLAAILTASELERCRREEHGGGREARAASFFAAKEAFLKALGTGLIGRLSWHDIEVIPEGRRGRAALALRGEAARLAAEAGIENVDATLTVAAGHAAAMVVVSS